MDSMEAVWWGKFCVWGTNKHPPLSGFPAYGIYLLFSENIKAVYILSQICITVGFCFIYKLASLLLEQRKAVLSVMLLEGCVFYGFCSPEYNVNVMSLALWPAVAYFFYRAVTENTLCLWCLAAIACAANFLNKYTAAWQLLGCAGFLFFTPEGWKMLKSYRPYVALAVFLLLIFPHFYWLWQHDFMVIEYFSSRSGRVYGQEMPLWENVLHHLISPAEFLVSMLFYGAGTLALFFAFSRSLEPEEIDLGSRRFLFWLGLFPLLLVLAYGLISGSPVKSMWGYPLFCLLGIMLFKFVKFNMSAEMFIKLQKAVYILMAVYAAVYGVVLLLSNSPKYNLDGRKFAAEYTKFWHNQMSRPLKYVAGEVWLSGLMALESPDKPAPVIWGEPRRNPWIDFESFKRNGALVFAESREEYNAYMSGSQQKAVPPEEIVLQFENIFGKKRKKKIYYGFLRGERL